MSNFAKNQGFEEKAIDLTYSSENKYRKRRRRVRNKTSKRVLSFLFGKIVWLSSDTFLTRNNDQKNLILVNSTDTT